MRLLETPGRSRSGVMRSAGVSDGQRRATGNEGPCENVRRSGCCHGLGQCLDISLVAIPHYVGWRQVYT